MVLGCFRVPTSVNPVGTVGTRFFNVFQQINPGTWICGPCGLDQSQVPFRF